MLLLTAEVAAEMVTLEIQVVKELMEALVAAVHQQVQLGMLAVQQLLIKGLTVVLVLRQETVEVEEVQVKQDKMQWATLLMEEAVTA